jgi:hypothetical protein
VSSVSPQRRGVAGLAAVACRTMPGVISAYALVTSTVVERYCPTQIRRDLAGCTLVPHFPASRSTRGAISPD